MPTIGSLFAGIGGFDLGFERAGFKTVWQCEIDKAAQIVLRHRFPDAALHSDVREVGSHNLAAVDVVTFGSPCFPAGVLVLTRRGLLPIEEVIVGDEVVSHLGRWQPVVRVGSKVAPTIRLKGQGHPGLVTTEEHPFWASTVIDRAGRGTGRSFSPLQWVPAKNMLGKMWSSLSSFPTEKMPEIVAISRWEKNVPKITKELMRVVGAWVGDGSVYFHTHKSGSIAGRVVITDAASATEEHHKRLSEAGVKYWVSEKTKTMTKFIIASAPFARWLTENFGRYAHGKTIPSWLLGAPQDFREAFLEGYFFTDGCDMSGDTRTSSASKALTFGIAMMMRCTYGKSVSLYFQKARGSREILGVKVKKFRDSWSAHMHDTARSSVMLDGYRMGLVRECEPTGVEERVYNIEVEGDNSYTADGIIVHNCQDLSVAGKRAGLAGGRSGLFHEAARIIRELRQQYGKPDFAIWENVPGAFSSNDGRDFAAVVQAMVDLGARDVCWRVLDSRYFGVAQRRRRVFLVADFGGERSEQILFESESLRGNPAKGQKARKGFAASSGAGVDGSGEYTGTLTAAYHKGTGNSGSVEREYVAVAQPIAFQLNGDRDNPSVSVSEGTAFCLSANPMSDRGQAIAQPIAFHPTQLIAIPIIADADRANSSALTPSPDAEGRVRLRDPGLGVGRDGDPMFTLQATRPHSVAVTQPIVFDTTQITSPYNYSSPKAGDPCHPLAAGAHPPAVAYQPIAFHPTQDPISSTNGISHTMSNGSKGGTATVAFAVPMINMQGSKGNAVAQADGPSYTLNAMHGHDVHAVAVPVAFDILGTPASEVAKPADVHTPLRARTPGQYENSTTTVAVCATGEVTHTLTSEGFDASEDGTGRGIPITAVCATGEITHTLTTTSNRGATEDGTGRGCPVVAQPYTLAERGRVGGATLEARQDGTANCLLTPSGGRGGMGVGAIAMPPMQVRRLTPTEAEALQGFPRNWTAEGTTEDGKIKQQADGPRYKQLGNAVTVNVAEWIARRVRAVMDDDKGDES